MQRESEEVEHGKLNLITRDRPKPAITTIETYELMFDNVWIDLNNYCYSVEMIRNIISFQALFRQ